MGDEDCVLGRPPGPVRQTRFAKPPPEGDEIQRVSHPPKVVERERRWWPWRWGGGVRSGGVYGTPMSDSSPIHRHMLHCCRNTNEYGRKPDAEYRTRRGSAPLG